MAANIQLSCRTALLQLGFNLVSPIMTTIGVSLSGFWFYQKNMPDITQIASQIFNFSQASTEFTSSFTNLTQSIANFDMMKTANSSAAATNLFVEQISEKLMEILPKNMDRLQSEVAKDMLKVWVPALLVLGIVTTGFPLAYTYFQQVLIHNIGKPPLALKQRKISIYNSLLDRLYPSRNPKMAKPIFKKEVEEQIQTIVDATNNIQKNKSYFQNVVLFGPGGTGKSMIAEKIAHEAGMNYIMMSGGELGQFIKRGAHVTELNKLLNVAEKSSYPTIIFVDEAESLCKKRDQLDQEHLELQNKLLNRTGTPSKKMMLILATNRIADLDSAILNRMTHKILIDRPGLEERIKIIDMYAKQFFTDEKERQEFFNPKALQDIAEKTENLTGRSLFYLLNMLFTKKCGTKNNSLSQLIVGRTVDDFVKQEKTIDQLTS